MSAKTPPPKEPTVDKKPTRRIPKPKAPNGSGQYRLPKVLAASGLPLNQEAYCVARATGMSITEAIKAIGFGELTPQTAYNWESTAKVKKRIQELRDIATENAILSTGLSRQWVISRLMTIVDRCMQAEPVRDSRGNIIEGEWQFDAKGANGALKMLGDTLSMFKDPPKPPERELESLSDDELTRLATELAAQVGLIERKDALSWNKSTQNAQDVEVIEHANVTNP